MFVFLFIASQIIMWNTFMRMGRNNENSDQSPEWMYYIIYGSIAITVISLLGILLSGVNIFDAHNQAPYMQSHGTSLPSLFK